MKELSGTRKVLTVRCLEYSTLAGLEFNLDEIACVLSVPRSIVKRVFEIIYLKSVVVSRLDAYPSADEPSLYNDNAVCSSYSS